MIWTHNLSFQPLAANPYAIKVIVEEKKILLQKLYFCLSSKSLTVSQRGEDVRAIHNNNVASPDDLTSVGGGAGEPNT